MTQLTQKELKEILHYDPETGVFTRLVRTANCVKVGDVAGHLHSSGYIEINLKGKRYYAHRLACLYMEGGFPTDETDHINHVKNDNKWINLRHVTTLENSKNQKMSKANKSGVTGVSWYNSLDRWVAEIQADREKIHLGCYKDWFEAVCARKSAENKYGFHKNHGATI